MQTVFICRFGCWTNSIQVAKSIEKATKEPVGVWAAGGIFLEPEKFIAERIHSLRNHSVLIQLNNS